MKKLSFIMVLIVTFILLGCNQACGFPEIGLYGDIFLPIDSQLLGTDTYCSNPVFGVTPYLSAAYDLKSETFLYRVGGFIKKNNSIYYINYGDWVYEEQTYVFIDNCTDQFYQFTADYRFQESYLPGYRHFRGFEFKMYRILDDIALTGDDNGDRLESEDQGLEFALFSGDVGKTHRQSVDTDYLFIGYFNTFQYGTPPVADDPKANSHRKEIKLEFLSTVGLDKLTNEFYSSSTLEVPITYHHWMINPKLGYTSQTSSIAPEYDLNSYLRGGEWHQLSGNRLAAATVEYRFFNSDSDFRPDCTAIFFDCGDILLPGESWDDLRMRYSYGISLIGELPIGNEFQIYLAVTDDKKCKLHCTLKYSFI